MKLLSVNVGQPREVEYKGDVVRTGIFKQPVSGRVTLAQLNLAGDKQADLIAHGGIYKAVYAYPFENYGFWENELDRHDFEYGQFGENLTVEGMPEDQIHIGDTFRIGSALAQVTQPRVPCYKLGIRMGDPKFVKRFLNAERSGFYLRVLEEGEVGAGDSIELVTADPHGMTVREVNHLLYFDNENVEGAKRALQLEALAPVWRGSFEAIVANHAVES